MWQFIRGTAVRYDLKVTAGTDERKDWEKSTVAAAAYLNDLAFDFGVDALFLALAGYNRGEGGVRRALRNLSNPYTDRSYWRLKELQMLPEETRNYVPRFVAHAVAGEGGLPVFPAEDKAID
jgi:membrane-bound lytic murein transglycosylase D